MGRLGRTLVWMIHPPALVGFAALCLCIGAAGSLARSSEGLKAAQAHQTPRSPVMGVQAPAVDCEIRPCLALTFDDGPHPQITPQVLDILARQQVKATFFVVGAHVAGQEALLQREYREGHEIGNHSWNHPDLTKLTPEDTEAQIQSTQKVIAAAGVPAPRILRPPYGAINQMVAAHNHLSVVRWNVDPEDWKYQDAPAILASTLAQARPGAIILMHDIYPSTAAALEPVIVALKQQYQFVTASQLLDLTPGDQGQFFARFR